MINKNLSIAIKELRNIDYDSYLSAIFTLRNNFEKIITVSLLQNQLKRIYYAVNDDMVGLVRLNWWKESLDDIFIKNKDNKNYLLSMIFKYHDQINYQTLSRSIKAFEKDFSEDKKFKNITELENYISLTEGSFYLLAMELVDGNNKDLLEKSAKYFGEIFFYYDLLKRIKNENGAILRFFCSDFFNTINNAPKSWSQNPHEENLKVMINYVYFHILSAIEQLELIEQELPKSCYYLVLKKDLVKINLANLKKNNFDVFKTNFSSRGFATKMKFLLKVFIK
jgi:NADH dehydrogenase [ubiquinone] 1 alpha subcomplex assembly factor 6